MQFYFYCTFPWSTYSLSVSGSDIVLWKHAHDDYQASFSAVKTWEQIRDRRENVDSCDIIWFTQVVPRFSFIVWLVIKNRLSTGDRMRNWGLQQECLLCGEKNEIRDHLFFACPYSYMVWITVTWRLLGSRITPKWQDTVMRIRYDHGSTLDKILGIMVFQMTVYHIWREIIARRHGKPWTQMEKLAHQIDEPMRNRISSLRYQHDSKLEGLMKRLFEVTMWFLIVTCLGRFFTRLFFSLLFYHKLGRS